MNQTIKRTLAAFVAVTLMTTAAAAKPLPYQNPKLDIDTRVDDLISRMTLDEKLEYISGMRKGGHSAETWDGSKGNERLGIVPFNILHGPYGVKNRNTGQSGTYYPASILTAATWNPELIEQMQQEVGRELKVASGNSSAGPAMNIIRDLRGGRSSEYFTEDPYLNGEVAVASVLGLQSQGHFSIMKHYICNNQDRNRNLLDVRVGERALREIYMPGYKAAVVRGGVLGVMTGYNNLNGMTTCENKHIVQDVLKDEWGFKGVVMTDWMGSGSSAETMINAGLDFEMPFMIRYKPELVKKALASGKVTEAQINEMVRRVLYVTYKCGVMDNPPQPTKTPLITEASVEMARKVAEDGIVLLKNDGDLLPIQRDKVKKLAVIGPSAEYGAHFRGGKKSYQMFQGGGSATIAPKSDAMITPLRGIKKIAGKQMEIHFEPGCYGEHGTTVIPTKYLKTKSNEAGLAANYYDTNDFKGAKMERMDKNIDFIWQKSPDIMEDGVTKNGTNDRVFSVRWSGKLMVPESRNYTFEIEALGVARLYLNGKLIVDKNAPTIRDRFEMGDIYLEKGECELVAEYQSTERNYSFSLMWDYGNDQYLKRAVELAKSCDMVVMAVGTSGKYETEGVDRDAKLNMCDPLALSVIQEQLIREVAAVNKNVAVVTYSAGLVMENWRDRVSSIVYSGFPGQEGGNALANILFGEVNPSGKLPVTLPKSVDQYPRDFHTKGDKITYHEGIYVGYRYFDKLRLEPAFCFGHGLSYTTFSYEDIAVKKGKDDSVDVSFTLRNSGKAQGKEVAQLYVRDDKCSVERPDRELKGFTKVALDAGESKRVTIKLDSDAFKFFSESENKWVLEPGRFTLMVGSSHDDIRLSEGVTL